MPERPRVVVLGSVHMDLIATADRLPSHGESVTDGTFTMSPGGKGGNQACQFALAGAEAQMLTRLGDDLFGRQLLHGLQAKGVDTSLVVLDGEAATGASCVLAGAGDYASVIAPGAAARLGAADLERARTAIESADALVLQLELPAAISAAAARIAAEAGRMVILNASPAPDSAADLPESLWRDTSVLVVNAVEAGRLLRKEFGADELAANLAELAAVLDIDTVVVTLGPDGIAAFQDGRMMRQPAFLAKVADSVGAGDAFLGVFATALLEGAGLASALRRGAAAGALAVSRPGVYDALPSRADVDRAVSAGTEAV